MTDHRMDWDRMARTGTAEAVYAEGKSDAQIDAIIAEALDSGRRLLLTRLPADRQLRLAEQFALDCDPVGGTAILGSLPGERTGIGLVAAGTSDMPVAVEAARTLAFHGYAAPIIADVGVAGLWRLTERLEDIRSHRILIVFAGMEGALFSVLTGLVSAPIIAVPVAQGYGVSAGGRLALDAALGSCAGGLTAVNIGNGFGAALAAIRMMRLTEQAP